MISLMFCIVGALILFELLPVILMALGIFALWIFTIAIDLFVGKKD